MRIFKEPPRRPDISLPFDFFPQISSAASAMDCTGLMPTAPITLEEWESYQSLCSTALPPLDF